MHNFVQINLSSRVKSTNQDYGNHGITATLQKHYHYYYESQAKIHNITEIKEQLQRSEQLYIVVVHTV